jgi:hypothetical protein
VTDQAISERGRVQFCWQTKLFLAAAVHRVFSFFPVGVSVRPCILVDSVAWRCYLLCFHGFLRFIVPTVARRWIAELYVAFSRKTGGALVPR